MPPFHPLSMEEPQFNLPQDKIADKGKGKAQFEADVASVRRFTRMQRDGTDEPNLRHARDHTRDAEAEGADCGDTRWQSLGIVVNLGDITREAVLEEEMIAEGDSFIYSKPILLSSQLAVVCDIWLQYMVFWRVEVDVVVAGSDRAGREANLGAEPRHSI
jgi:hypothetical protein